MSERWYVVVDTGPDGITALSSFDLHTAETARLRVEGLRAIPDYAGTTFEAYALVPVAALRTEFGWAPDGDVSDLRVPKDRNPAERERWVRQCVAVHGGSVFEREVTEWRQEP